MLFFCLNIYKSAALKCVCVYSVDCLRTDCSPFYTAAGCCCHRRYKDLRKMCARVAASSSLHITWSPNNGSTSLFSLPLLLLLLYAFHSSILLSFTLVEIWLVEQSAISVVQLLKEFHMPCESTSLPTWFTHNIPLVSSYLFVNIPSVICYRAFCAKEWRGLVAHSSSNKAGPMSRAWKSKRRSGPMWRGLNVDVAHWLHNNERQICLYRWSCWCVGPHPSSLLSGIRTNASSKALWAFSVKQQQQKVSNAKAVSSGGREDATAIFCTTLVLLTRKLSI